MSQLLAPFDANRTLEELTYNRAHLQIPYSMMGLVEAATSVHLELRYGFKDQCIASALADVFTKSGGVAAFGNEHFTEICDLLLQLERPDMYRLEKSGDFKGYRLSDNDFYLALQTAYDGGFPEVLLGNLETQHSVDGGLVGYNGINIVLRKIKNEDLPKLP